jgi:cellulose synthase (UDP-forming)
LRAALLAAHVSASIAYIVWRAGWTMNAEHPVFAALVLLAEAALLACGFVFYFMILRRPERAAPPRLLTRTPTIDVLIATYNEDVELLRLTATAARDMELPHRTFICDDGRRPAMAALARELGVGYLTRPDNLDFKAGNLNHALARTDGELVLVLDADHVPHPALLSRTVGHFADEQVALVQTPQVYYNVDSFQHDLAAGRPLWHEGVLFHHVIQPGADRLNAAFFVGTGGVVRRSALAAIGNFATGSITEDIHTSMRLHAAGYRSVYVDEALGFMLAADTPFAYARQRERWCQGSMQILRSECPLWKRGLSLWQRIFYFNALSVYLTAYLHLVCYLAPGLFLLFGWSPIDAGNEHFANELPEVGCDAQAPAAVEGEELQRLVAEAVATLPASDREVYEQRFVKGLTQLEAARALGITRIQVRRRENRLKRSLLASLKAAGYGDSAAEVRPIGSRSRTREPA